MYIFLFKFILIYFYDYYNTVVLLSQLRAWCGMAGYHDSLAW